MAFRRLVLFCLGGSDASKHASLRFTWIHLEPNRSGGWAFEIMSGRKWWVELVFDQPALMKKGFVMPKSGPKAPKHTFRCTECGSTHPTWAGKCPDCGTWDALERVEVEEVPANVRLSTQAAGRPSVVEALAAVRH